MLELIGRKEKLFIEDFKRFEKEISEKIRKSKFLVLGGAGSIGQAVTKEIFKKKYIKRKPKLIRIDEF